MGNKDHHYHHKVSSFTPAWCLRPPLTKDTTPRNPSSNNINKKKSHRRRHSPEISIEPSSPRVGCMGQIRRCKPPSSSSSSSSGSSSATPENVTGQFNLLKLKRVFSSKVSVEGMDPPRPVERREVRGENSVSLWKRRCGGGDGLRLQLQQMEQICT